MADKRLSNEYYQAIAKELGIKTLDTADELAYIEREAAAIGIQDIDSSGDVKQFYSSNGYTGPTTSPGSDAEALQNAAQSQFDANQTAVDTAKQNQADYIGTQEQQSLLALQQNNALIQEQIQQQDKQFTANLNLATEAQAEATRQFEMQYAAQQEAVAQAQAQAAEQARRASNIANAFIPSPEETAYSAAMGDYREGQEENRESSTLGSLFLRPGVGGDQAQQNVSLSGLVIA